MATEKERKTGQLRWTYLEGSLVPSRINTTEAIVHKVAHSSRVNSITYFYAQRVMAMRNALAVVMAGLALVSAPALGGEGDVPPSALAALGLGDMTPISDSQGLAVRGLSSSAATMGTSLVFGQLLDPATPGNFFVASDTNGGGSSAENGGLQILSLATSGPQGSSIAGQLTLQSGDPLITSFLGTFLGNAGHAANLGSAGISFSLAR